MIAGLLIAVFISYRKPRDYQPVVLNNTKKQQKSSENEQESQGAAESVVNDCKIKPRYIAAGIIAIIVALIGQFYLDSLVIAALAGILVFVISGVISMRDTQDVFTKGVYLMGGIGIVMIAAAGFAEVLKATGSVDELVKIASDGLGNNRGLAIFLMLLIGLIITMGIGSSFSTVPLIAAIYVPLCIELGISPLATIAIVGVAGALGDAGSPVSESVLGPTAGLNADGQHDHIYDSTIPTFLHYNLPLLAAGWIAGMIL